MFKLGRVRFHAVLSSQGSNGSKWEFKKNPHVPELLLVIASGPRKRGLSTRPAPLSPLMKGGSASTSTHRLLSLTRNRNSLLSLLSLLSLHCSASTLKHQRSVRVELPSRYRHHQDESHQSTHCILLIIPVLILPLW